MDVLEYFEMEESHAIFRPSGQVSLEQVIQLIREAITTARASGVKKLLINITELEGFESPSIGTRYFLFMNGLKLPGALFILQLLHGTSLSIRRDSALLLLPMRA